MKLRIELHVYLDCAIRHTHEATIYYATQYCQWFFVLYGIFFHDICCMAFWDVVKYEVKAQTKKQEKLAEAAGIKWGTFAGWIARNRLPRVDEGYAIAKALEVSVEYLVTGQHPTQFELKDAALLERARRWEGLLADLAAPRLRARDDCSWHRR